MIGQAYKNYLQKIIQYQKTLRHTNALLKQMGSFGNGSNQTLQIYNEQLVKFGTPIHISRLRYLSAFEPLFKKRYSSISGEIEIVSISYESQLLKSDFETLLENSANQDRNAQFSTAGIHKDDLIFKIDNYPIKKFGSQGQRKSLLIALKLAQFDMLKQSTQVTPILLLDDIFDKLDEKRVAKIVSLVYESSFGQLFLTDTHSKRTADVIKKTQQSFQLHHL